MPDTQSLFDELESAADYLGDPAVLEIVRAGRALGERARLRVLIVGSTGSGRFSLANAILSMPNLLPPTPLPKTPAPLTVRYGPLPCAEFSYADGNREAVHPTRLSTALLDRESGREVARIDVEAPAGLLSTCEIHVEALEAARDDDGWRSILAGSDFVLLTLRAPALLSQHEKDFVRNLLVPFGLQRVAILLNQMDLIPDDERDAIESQIGAFLGPFESQPAVLPISAREMLGALAMDESPPSVSGYPALRALVSDLVEDHGPLRRAALEQALRSGIDALETAAERQQALLSLGHEEVDRVRELIASRREWLAGRVRRTHHRIDAFVATLVKERLLREIDGFGDVFRHRLPDEVMRVDDVGAVRRYLPGYMESVWTEFLQRQLVAVHSALLEELRAVSRLIETDLQDLVGEEMPRLRQALSGFAIDPSAFHAFVMPKRGKHRADNVAKGLGVYGYAMVFFNPALGILSLAASQVVQRFFQGDINIADKKAMTTAAISASRDMQHELVASISVAFTELGIALRQEADRLYREGVERIEAFTADTHADRQQMEARRAAIDTLLTSTIPDLRRAQTDMEAAGLASGVPA